MLWQVLSHRAPPRLSHQNSYGASSASRGAFQCPLRNPFACNASYEPPEADRTRARARSAAPAATHFKRRLLSPTQAAVAPRAPRAARFSARFVTFLHALYLMNPPRPTERAPGRSGQRAPRQTAHADCSFPPKQLRRLARLARRVSAPVAQPVSLYWTQMSPRGRQNARQGAPRNARRDRQTAHHTQMITFCHPNSCGASVRLARRV